MIVQCATFSKSLNPRNIDKSVSDIRIRFRFESSFWISLSGCKLTVLPDIQPANRIVIISAVHLYQGHTQGGGLRLIFYKTLLPAQRILIVFAYFLLVNLSTE